MFLLLINFFQYKEKFWLLDNFYVTLNFILIPDKSVVHKNDGSPVFSTKSNVFFFFVLIHSYTLNCSCFFHQKEDILYM